MNLLKNTLPPEMMKKAEHVRDTMYKMMDLGQKVTFRFYKY